MNYFKINLKSSKMVYALREYFPYTDKPFFKCLDDLITDESLQVSLAHLFVQLYKDELIFEFESLNQHKYITPVIHQSKKFTTINKIICERIAEFLKIKVLDDYFELIEIPRVDIRDDYTKENFNIALKVNEEAQSIPTIVFDCCCSTGIIFENLQVNNKLSEDNLYLSYGIRYNSQNLNNTYVNEVEEYEFDPSKYDSKSHGRIVRIYGLFGTKNIEVDFTKRIIVGIGENGFGKSTASKIALLAIEYYENSMSLSVDYKHNTSLELSKYYFDKIEVYYTKQDYNTENSIIEDVYALQTRIFYSDVIPFKKELINDAEGDTLLFLKTIDRKDYENIVRKIIINDRTIELDYNNILFKYKIDVNVNEIDRFLRDIVIPIDRYKETYCSNYKKYIYYNCAKSRNLVPKFSKTIVKLDFYSEYEKYLMENGYDDYDYSYDDFIDYNENTHYKSGQEILEYYDYLETHKIFGYSLKNLRENPKLIVESLNKNIFQLYNEALQSNITVYKNYNNEEEYFNRKNISIHKVLENCFQLISEYHPEPNSFLYFKEPSLGEIETNFFSILNKIKEFITLVELKNDKISIYKNEYFELTVSVEDILTESNKSMINNIYYNIFNENYETILYGVYEILIKEDYKIFSKMINSLRVNGITKPIEHLIVMGISLLIKSYKESFISKNHILFEKILNKYFIDKKVKVFTNNLIVTDVNNNFIPLDKLSTGEKNLIIIFSLCLKENNRIIILDEPDLSMSIDWQSKLIQDLLKYTNNSYIIISQSPLLVQKNNLSCFVKRMEFEGELPTVPLKSLQDPLINWDDDDIIF